VGKIIPYLVGLFLFFSLSLSAQEEKRLTLLEQCEKYGQAEVQFTYPGYDNLTEIGKHISVRTVKDNIVNAVISRIEIDAFLELGISYKLVKRNVSKGVLSASSVSDAMNWDIYPTYQQYDSIMHKFANDFPAICRVDTIGQSIEGRQVMALKISDNVEINENEPEVFYSSTIHGDELAGYVLMLRFAEHFLINSSNGGLEEKLIDSLEIWINPLSNPDGTYNFGDTITTPTRYNANSYDLNRNFPDPTVTGSTLQKENEDMIGFMTEHDFILSANFHSGTEVLNFPWDRGDAWGYRNHADSTWFYDICRAYADTVHEYSSPDYMTFLNDGVTMGYAWYAIYSGRQDYVTYEQQGREVTIELDYTFETPGSELPVLWDYNYRSLLRYLENAFYGLHGNVVDDSGDDPLYARIFIESHDKDSSHVYTDSLSGNFARLIEPGSYNITISAEGYYDSVLNNILIEDRIQTFRQVRMTEIPVAIDQINYRELKIWPVPTVNELFINMPAGLPGGSTFRIIDYYGREIVFREDIQGIDIMNIDVSYLKPGMYFCLTENKIEGIIHLARFIKF